jgi:hypothetical protein
MKIITTEYPIYNIQENGLISNPSWGEGRLIPAVVLNGVKGIELQEFLKIHTASNEPGDATTQWASPLTEFFNPKTWLLSVKFTKPQQFTFYIEFILDQHPSLIDAIFQSRGLYITYGFPGDKISKRNTQDIVLMEVPDLDQDYKWNITLRKILKERYKKLKISKKEMNIEVEKQIQSGRQILNYRKK